MDQISGVMLVITLVSRMARASWLLPSQVHVQDTSDLILLSVKHNLNSTKPAGFERFYLYVIVEPVSITHLLTLTHFISIESGEHQKLQLNTELATILSAKKLVSVLEPLSVSADSPLAPSWANKTTSRCFANRARKELGWAPKLLLEDMFEEEILDILTDVMPDFDAA
jgi:hypothetical protein